MLNIEIYSITNCSLWIHLFLWIHTSIAMHDYLSLFLNLNDCNGVIKPNAEIDTMCAMGDWLRYVLNVRHLERDVQNPPPIHREYLHSSEPVPPRWPSIDSIIYTLNMLLIALNWTTITTRTIHLLPIYPQLQQRTIRILIGIPISFDGFQGIA